MFPVASEPVAVAPGPTIYPAAFLELIESQAPGQFLVEIAAYKGGEARSGGLWTVAEGPVATVPGGVGVTIGQVTLTFADRHWVGEPDDADKPNAYYEGRVLVPLVMERSMPIAPEDPRRVQKQYGQIEIANGDGMLDAILQSYAVDGRRVVVRFGPLMPSAYNDFRTVADVLATGWEGNETRLALNIRDQSYELDKPLQTTLYAGTGGAEGGADLEGKPKPLAFGRVRNIAPVLIDATNLVYQVHDGPIAAVDDVFHRGAALTDSGVDVSGYAALVAQSVSSGQFATALDVGMFKINLTLEGLFTCDVRGDADPDYQNTLDQICLRVLLDRHGLSPLLVDSGSFANVAAIGGEMGIFISHQEQPTTADVLSRLMAAAGGYWGQGARDRRVAGGRLVAPENRSPNLYLDQYDIIALEPEASPVSRWRQRCAYQPNWTQQRGEDLATTVTAARRQFLTETERAVAASDALVKLRHLAALDPDPIQTFYENEADAQTLADTLLALHKVDRRIFRVTVKRIGFLAKLGSIVRVTYPRMGLDDGQNFVAVGIREDGDREETVLRLWG